MPQSLAKILIHLIYSTKHRERILGDDIRDQLHSYAAAVLKECQSPAIKINSVEDHIHILYSHSKNHSPAKIVEEVKVATPNGSNGKVLPIPVFIGKTGMVIFQSVNGMFPRWSNTSRTRKSIIDAKPFRKSTVNFSNAMRFLTTNDMCGIDP